MMKMKTNVRAERWKMVCEKEIDCLFISSRDIATSRSIGIGQIERTAKEA